MTRKVLIALGLAVAVGFAPLAAVAHEGHDHGPRAKKVKKSKLKKETTEHRMSRTPAPMANHSCAAAPRSDNKSAIVRPPLTSR